MRGYRSVFKIGYISAALSGQGGLISRTVASNRSYSQNGSVNILACEQAVRGALSAGREREGELATTFLEFEYLHRKSRCEMLIGGDDISNDVITLGTCFSMLFTFAFVTLRSDWRKSENAQSTGSCRGIGGGIQIASCPSFTRPAARMPPRAARRQGYV